MKSILMWCWTEMRSMLLDTGEKVILAIKWQRPWLNCVYVPVFCGRFSSVHLLSRVRLFAAPWTAACQASLSIINSQSLPKLISIESVMPSNHLILCRPLLLLPSIFPRIRVFSNDGSPPGAVLAASPNGQFEPESAGAVGASTLLRLHHANWLTVWRLGALQGQCADCCGDQLAGGSGDWKLPLRTPHVGKERVAREQGFIRENKQCFMR